MKNIQEVSFLLHSAITHETYWLSCYTACGRTLILVWADYDG